jgi:hypothetical protein
MARNAKSKMTVTIVLSRLGEFVTRHLVLPLIATLGFAETAVHTNIGAAV